MLVPTNIAQEKEIYVKMGRFRQRSSKTKAREKHLIANCVAQLKKVIRCGRRQFAAALTPDKQTTWGSQPLTDRLS
jgi:hypothetical protein